MCLYVCIPVEHKIQIKLKQLLKLPLNSNQMKSAVVFSFVLSYRAVIHEPQGQVTDD